METFWDHEAEQAVRHSKRAAVGLNRQVAFVPGLTRSGSTPPIPNLDLPVAGSCKKRPAAVPGQQARSPT